MKYNIYALYDPRTNSPFYVGATQATLESRLSNHLSFYPNSKGDTISKKRRRLIDEILLAGMRPIIKLLKKVPFTKTSKSEEDYYNLFTEQGFILLQHKSFFKYKECIGNRMIPISENRYRYPLKLDLDLKEPLTKRAEQNRRPLNTEINIAIEEYLKFTGYII